MLIGPSGAEVAWLLQTPAVISALLIVCLLIVRRSFKALSLAAVATVVYVLTSIALLRSSAGAFMLLFSGWAAVAFLSIALYSSFKKSTAGADDTSRVSAPLQDAASTGKGGLLGRRLDSLAALRSGRRFP